MSFFKHKIEYVMTEVVALDNENREKLISDIKKQVEAMAAALGPRGQNILKDSVEKFSGEKPPEDPEASAGQGLIHEVVSGTAQSPGDGSSTAAVLARELLCRSLKHISGGADPIELKKGIEKGMQHLEEFFLSSSQPVLTPEQLLKVAITAAGGDREIGGLVVEAFEKVGANGLIQLMPAEDQKSKVQTKGSNTFNTRFSCPYCAPRQAQLKVLYEEPFLLMTNHRITSPSPIEHLLDQLLPTQRPILIITNSADGEVPPAFVLTHRKGIARVSVLRAPKSLGASTESLEDLALLTGGRVINREIGERLEDVSLDDLGTAAQLEVSNDFTSIVDGKGSDKQLEERKKQLDALLIKTEDGQQKNELKERLAFIIGGSAVIFLAASSESAFKDKKERAEKAIHASRAALAEGILPGAGLSLIRGYEALQSLKADSPDQEKGLETFRQALLLPAWEIAENAGAAGKEVVEESLAKRNGYGYNALSGSFDPLLEAGIADAAKVLRIASRNAVSVTGRMLGSYSVVQPAMA
jgi:chaperonin GroEL